MLILFVQVTAIMPRLICENIKTQRNVKNSLSAPHKSAAHPGYQNKEVQDFPGGPVVKTQHFHGTGCRF